MKKKNCIIVFCNNEKDGANVLAALDSSRYDAKIRLASEASPFVSSNFADCDLRIVCLPEDLTVYQGLQDEEILSHSKRSLFISDSTSSQIRLWAFRHGAHDYIIKPYLASVLNSRVERLLLSDKKYLREEFTEERTLNFLKNLLDNGTEVVEPALSPFMPSGHFYQRVAQSFDRTGNDMEFMEQLAEEGLVSRKIVNRIRLCPVCDDHHLNYRESCPKCSSLNFSSEQVVHHFSCGNMGPLSSYKQGAQLVCPKCGDTLRHIGLDYEKPAGNFHCSDCDYIFSEPKVDAQCIWCGYVCPPEKTIEKLIYSYELTNLAREAVESRQIKGVDLATILLNKETGLYSRQFFVHELQREFVRAHRYEYVFSILMIKIKDFEHIKTEHSAKAVEYIHTMFKALSEHLRTLDTICVWSGDTLSVILSGTGKEGSETVAKRMYEKVRGLEYLYDIHEPELVINLVTSDKKYKDYKEMLNECSKDME